MIRIHIYVSRQHGKGMKAITTKTVDLADGERLQLLHWKDEEGGTILMLLQNKKGEIAGGG